MLHPPPLLPNPDDPRLTVAVEGIDQSGAAVASRVPVERALTIYLNAQEIVTAMTVGDHPEDLAVGFLANQGMLEPGDAVTGVDFDEELGVVVVRTERATDYEARMRKRVLTSGCAQGTAFGDLMEGLEGVVLPEAEVRASWLVELLKRVNTTPSLYLTAGAIHGAVLSRREEILLYAEDVGRHNAVDKAAGWLRRTGVSPADLTFYTTGRLTSEMVIKTVRMGLPVLVSRSGFTAWGVELARAAGLTLIGRARGGRFLALSRPDRIVFDRAGAVEEEAGRGRKGEGQRERRGEGDD